MSVLKPLLWHPAPAPWKSCATAVVQRFDQCRRTCNREEPQGAKTIAYVNVLRVVETGQSVAIPFGT